MAAPVPYATKLLLLDQARVMRTGVAQSRMGVANRRGE